MDIEAKDIENYLKDEKEQKLLLNVLSSRLDEMERQIQDKVSKFKNGENAFARHLMSTQGELLQRISTQLVEKVQQRNQSNLRKLRGLKQKKPTFKNEEIKMLQQKELMAGNMHFRLLSPKEYTVTDIKKKEETLLNYQNPAAQEE